MAKPPEIVLCEVANDDPSSEIATNFYDLETRLIDTDPRTVNSARELASIESCHYDSAGNLVSSGEEVASSPGDRYKFTGRQWNEETALQYNRTRRNDDRKARWTSQDPLAFAGDDANLYRHPKTESQ